jgi:hypothetical protein
MSPALWWRGVNCDDCVDHDILANRGNDPVSARVRARPPTGLNTPDGRAEREQAGLGDWFVTVTITEGALPLSE